MNSSFQIATARPSALSRLLKRPFRSLSGLRPNFVRPLTQPLDPAFNCPCCSKKLSVPASQAGEKGRCRHCFKPIRNASPTKGKPAVDLSKEMDPIARPKDYKLGGHSTSLVDYIPRGAIAALPLLALIAIGVGLIAMLPKGDYEDGVLAAAKGPTPIELITSPAIEAEELVSTFLTQDDWTRSVANVHDGLAVAAEIATLSQRMPEGGFKTSSKLNEDGTSTVRVNFHDGSLTHFQVANIAGEDLILWDTNPHGIPVDINSRMVGMPEMEPK